MDSITLGRMQCIRFLLKAVYEMLGKIEIRNDLDYYSEKHINSELIGAKSSVACAIETLEKALEPATKPGAN